MSRPLPKRVLLVQPGSMSDVCRSIPAIASLRRAYPDARIDAIVAEGHQELLAADPNLQEVLAVPPSRTSRWSRLLRPAPEVRRWLDELRKKNYDLAFDLLGREGSGAIVRATGASRRIGQAGHRLARNYTTCHVVPDSILHESERVLALLNADGVSPVHDFRLHVPTAAVDWWTKRRGELGITAGHYAVIAPTSRFLTTRWPADRWLSLVRPLLMREFTHIVFVGGQHERDQLRDVLPSEEVSGPILNLINRTSVSQLMAVIQLAGIMLGNDAAPLHIASALNVRCLGLFGPTDPARTGPWRKPLSALRMFVPKPGEVLDLRDEKLGDRLMRVISSAAVVQQIDRVLQASSNVPSTAGLPEKTPAVSSASKLQEPLYLASSSPRRRAMLEEAGIVASVVPPDVDDGKLTPGNADPEQWVMALAYLKARRVADLLHSQGVRRGTVLGADTVCVQHDRILGQPRDGEHALHMLKRLQGRIHFTLTGVCLFDLSSGRREMFADRAEVRVASISDEIVERYVASGEWRGKAGGYNLADRQAAGWPIEVIGDPCTVMGLPMNRLISLLPRAQETPV